MRQRSLPFIEIPVPARIRRSVEAQDLDCEPCSVFMTLGAP